MTSVNPATCVRAHIFLFAARGEAWYDFVMANLSARRSFVLTIPTAILFALAFPALRAASPIPARLLSVSAPTVSEAHSIGQWYEQHIPGRFRATEPIEVSLLTAPEMSIFLGADSDDHSADNDDGDIDGVFQNNPPNITLRLPASGSTDPMVFGHEYGHYVWFDIFSEADRQRYRMIYAHQKAQHRLITDYAADCVEEGFAEAFSFFVGQPAALQAQDPASYRFLAQWPAR